MQYRVEFYLDGKLVLFEELPFKPESYQHVIIRNEDYLISNIRYDVTNKNYAVDLIAVYYDGSLKPI